MSVSFLACSECQMPLFAAFVMSVTFLLMVDIKSTVVLQQMMAPVAWEAKSSSACFRRLNNVPKFCEKFLCQVTWEGSLRNHNCHCVFFFPYMGTPALKPMYRGIELAPGQPCLCCVVNCFLELFLSPWEFSSKRGKGSITQMGMILVLKMKVVGDSVSKCWLNLS